MAPSGGEQGPCRHLNTVARVKNLLGSRRYSSVRPPATSGVARVSETCRAVLVPYRVTFMIIFSSSSEMCIYESPWYPVNPYVRRTGGSAEQWLVRPRTWSLWRKSRSRECARAAKKTINGFRSSKRSGHSGARGREVDSMREAKEDGEMTDFYSSLSLRRPLPPVTSGRTSRQRAREMKNHKASIQKKRRQSASSRVEL